MHAKTLSRKARLLGLLETAYGLLRAEWLSQVFVFDSDACNPDEMRRSFLPPSRTAALSRSGTGSADQSLSSFSEDQDAMAKPGTQILAEATLIAAAGRLPGRLLTGL